MTEKTHQKPPKREDCYISTNMFFLSKKITHAVARCVQDKGQGHGVHHHIHNSSCLHEVVNTRSSDTQPKQSLGEENDDRLGKQGLFMSKSLLKDSKSFQDLGRTTSYNILYNIIINYQFLRSSNLRLSIKTSKNIKRSNKSKLGPYLTNLDWPSDIQELPMERHACHLKLHPIELFALIKIPQQLELGRSSCCDVRCTLCFGCSIQQAK